MTTQRNEYPEATTVAARMMMGSQARHLVLVAYTVCGKLLPVLLLILSPA